MSFDELLLQYIKSILCRRYDRQSAYSLRLIDMNFVDSTFQLVESFSHLYKNNSYLVVLCVTVFITRSSRVLCIMSNSWKYEYIFNLCIAGARYSSLISHIIDYSTLMLAPILVFSIYDVTRMCIVLNGTNCSSISMFCPVDSKLIKCVCSCFFLLVFFWTSFQCGSCL